jgi:hypothetical protein
MGPQGPIGPIQNTVYVAPTTDPQVKGAMWINHGVITFSAGLYGATGFY